MSAVETGGPTVLVVVNGDADLGRPSFGIHPSKGPHTSPMSFLCWDRRFLVISFPSFSTFMVVLSCLLCPPESLSSPCRQQAPSPQGRSSPGAWVSPNGACGAAAWCPPSSGHGPCPHCPGWTGAQLTSSVHGSGSDSVMKTQRACCGWRCFYLQRGRLPSRSPPVARTRLRGGAGLGAGFGTQRPVQSLVLPAPCTSSTRASSLPVSWIEPASEVPGWGLPPLWAALLGHLLLLCAWQGVLGGHVMSSPGSVHGLRVQRRPSVLPVLSPLPSTGGRPLLSFLPIISTTCSFVSSLCADFSSLVHSLLLNGYDHHLSLLPYF